MARIKVKYSASGTLDPEVWTEDFNFSEEGVNLWLVGPRDGRTIINYDCQVSTALRACEEEARHQRRDNNDSKAIGVVATNQFGAELAFAPLPR